MQVIPVKSSGYAEYLSMSSRTCSIQDVPLIFSANLPKYIYVCYFVYIHTHNEINP